MKILFTALALFSLTACGHMPTTDTVVKGDVATISVTGLAGSAVYLDGSHVGIIGEEGTLKIQTTSGMHTISVQRAGSASFKREIYAGPNTTTQIQQ